MKYFAFIALAVFFSLSSMSQSTNPKEKGLGVINEGMIKAQMNVLASDWTEGRETGGLGIDISADYIASMYQYNGLETFEKFRRTNILDGRFLDANSRDYFQDFSLLKPIPSEGHQLTIRPGDKSGEAFHMQHKIDFQVSERTIKNIDGTFPIVFAGYGFKTDDYDSFKGIDAKGKIVAILPAYPGWTDTTSVLGKAHFPGKSKYVSYMLLRNKLKNAKNAGAKAVILLSGDEDVLSNNSVNTFRYKTRDYEGDIPPVTGAGNRMMLPEADPKNLAVCYGSNRIFKLITKGDNFSSYNYDQNVIKEGKPLTYPCKDLVADLKVDHKSEVIRARNVIGIISGTDPSEIVVVGAHYDHMGKYQGRVWNGADDNASGTVAVMTLAKAFKASGIKPKKTIVFAAWSAEEKGLLGSRHFVKTHKGPSIRYYLNFDMIGRDNDKDTLKNNAKMVYTKAYELLRSMSEDNIVNYNLDLDVTYKAQSKPGGGSDHSSFSAKDIPVSYFMAGWHDEYHTPQDELGKINYTRMTNIIRLAYLNVWNVANADTFTKCKPE